MRSSSTCDVARLRVPSFGLPLLVVLVLDERVAGMAIVGIVVGRVVVEVGRVVVVWWSWALVGGGRRWWGW